MLYPGRSTSLLPNAEIIPNDYFAPLDLERIYGRLAPLEVDLGCGDGVFLVGLAANDPDRNFLGIERLSGRVRKTAGKITRLQLTNARVLRIETSYAIQHLLPPESVAVFHLMFPDPWPKRRHWDRRVITRDYLVSIHRALTPSGLFRVITDDIEYFGAIERVVSNSPEFKTIADVLAPRLASTFERRFTERGVTLYSLVLQKVSPVR